MSTPLVGLLLVFIAAAAVGLLETLIRRTLVAALLVLGLAVLKAAFPAEPWSMAIGRAGDAVFALIAVAAVARLLRLRGLTTRDRLLIGVSIIVVLSLLRGLPQYGLGVVPEFRTFLQFFGVALYFSTVRPHPTVLEKVGRAWLGGALALAVVVFLRWGASFTGVNLGPLAPDHASAQYALKALSGTTSFLLGQAFLMVLPTASAGGPDAPRRRLLAVVFGLFVLLLNRRTVWVTVLAGVVLLMIRNKRVSKRIAPLLVGTAIVASVVFLNLPETTSAEGGIAASATDTGTLEGRVQGWEALLAGGPQGTEWLIGKPLGAGFEREVSEHEVASNPHNFYVEMLLRTGVIGLTGMVALYLLTLEALRRAPVSQSGLLSRPTLFVLLVMQMIFLGAWTAESAQGVLLGLGCASFHPPSPVTGRAALVREGAQARRQPDGTPS